MIRLRGVPSPPPPSLLMVSLAKKYLFFSCFLLVNLHTIHFYV